MAENNSYAPLLPCPFCGGESKLLHHGWRSTGHGESSDKVEIQCLACKASVCDEDYAGYNIEGRKLMVIKAWGSRAPTQPQAVADGDTTTREQYRRMFEAACVDLGRINEALGLNPDDGGADPILEAIEELRATPAFPATEDSSAGDLAEHSSGPALDGGTPGPWRIRKRERDGELLDCFVEAPDCQGLPYAAEIMGDDEYREDLARKLADCELIVRAVNALRAGTAQAEVQAEPVTNAQIKAAFLANGFTIKEGLTDLKPYVYQAARALLQLAAPQAHPAFQQRVQPWMMECFGAEIAADRIERNHRFLEEALELVQATGCTQSEAHQLVDYVFGRPVGEPAQEVGGVMVTLAALCLANGLNMHQAGETELARVWTKVEAIRAKQAAKPKHSPLPQAQPADAPIAYLQEADQHLLYRFIETTQDDESFDIGKDAVKRLANLGVVESCGFGRYGVTMFGYWVHEHYWHQNPSLPLKTNADRDREHRAAMPPAQEGGKAAKEA